MIKLPNKIRIKARVSYELLWVDKFDDEKTMAECRGDSRQIVIKKGLSDTELMKTLIHEVLHALEFEHNLTIEHKTIYALEGAVLKLLTLNRWV